MSKIIDPKHIRLPSPDEDADILRQAAQDPDAQPLSAAELARMVPMRVARGRPKSDHTKQLLSIRYSPEVIAYFRAGGDGWQARINQVLAEYVVQQRAANPTPAQPAAPSTTENPACPTPINQASNN
jgi:uncharacterized protein (DUF4415 family)